MLGSTCFCWIAKSVCAVNACDRRSAYEGGINSNWLVCRDTAGDVCCGVMQCNSSSGCGCWCCLRGLRFLHICRHRMGMHMSVLMSLNIVFVASIIDGQNTQQHSVHVTAIVMAIVIPIICIQNVIDCGLCRVRENG